MVSLVIRADVAIGIFPDSPPGTEITWVAPTTNADGTALSDLAGFRVYYGVEPEAPSEMLQVANPAATSTNVPDLTTGTWYFYVTAYDTDGFESRISNQTSKVIT